MYIDNSNQLTTPSLIDTQNKRGKQAPFQTRIEMCQILFKDIPNVVVSDAEKVCFENASQGL